MKTLLVGYGEIGSGLYEVLSKKHQIMIYDPDKKKFGGNLQAIKILLVAIPYSDNFENNVRQWQKINPKATLIFSTVPVGTCSKLKALHFPIEGKHPHIARDLELNRHHFLGGHNEIIETFLLDAGLQFTILDKPEHTEFLKLRSTSYYGVCIEFARYSKRVADQIGLTYSAIKEYDHAYNSLVEKRGTPEHIRPVLDPPEGEIGGHCVRPNAEILNRQFPSALLGEITINRLSRFLGLGDKDPKVRTK